MAYQSTGVRQPIQLGRFASDPIDDLPVRRVAPASVHPDDVFASGYERAVRRSRGGLAGFAGLGAVNGIEWVSWLGETRRLFPNGINLLEAYGMANGALDAFAPGAVGTFGLGPLLLLYGAQQLVESGQFDMTDFVGNAPKLEAVRALTAFANSPMAQNELARIIATNSQYGKAYGTSGLPQFLADLDAQTPEQARKLREDQAYFAREGNKRSELLNAAGAIPASEWDAFGGKGLFAIVQSMNHVLHTDPSAHEEMLRVLRRAIDGDIAARTEWSLLGFGAPPAQPNPDAEEYEDAKKNPVLDNPDDQIITLPDGTQWKGRLPRLPNGEVDWAKVYPKGIPWATGGSTPTVAPGSGTVAPAPGGEVGPGSEAPPGATTPNVPVAPPPYVYPVGPLTGPVSSGPVPGDTPPSGEAWNSASTGFTAPPAMLLVAVGLAAFFATRKGR
jgi:hypothetical protein